MNEALKNILERNSHRNLVEPIPSKDEMEEVFQQGQLKQYKTMRLFLR